MTSSGGGTYSSAAKTLGFRRCTSSHTSCQSPQPSSGFVSVNFRKASFCLEALFQSAKRPSFTSTAAMSGSQARAALTSAAWSWPWSFSFIRSVRPLVKTEQLIS